MNMGKFEPGGATVPTSEVEISVRCEDLVDRDWVSRLIDILPNCAVVISDYFKGPTLFVFCL